MQDGSLRFIGMGASGDLLAECTGCGKCFSESRDGEVGTSKAIKRVKEKYKKHTCTRDFEPDPTESVKLNMHQNFWLAAGLVTMILVVILFIWRRAS